MIDWFTFYLFYSQKICLTGMQNEMQSENHHVLSDIFFSFQYFLFIVLFLACAFLRCCISIRSIALFFASYNFPCNDILSLVCFITFHCLFFLWIWPLRVFFIIIKVKFSSTIFCNRYFWGVLLWIEGVLCFYWREL